MQPDDELSEEREQASASARVRGSGLDTPRVAQDDDEAWDELRGLRALFLAEIDDVVDRLRRARASETAQEHLELLRSLLRAQVVAYLDHFISRKATLVPNTSVMYAGEVGPAGVLSTTLPGLIDAGTVTAGQAVVLARLVNERRTLVVFGDRATGKSTLLNSVFGLVPVDERLVAVERAAELPALKDRAFCLRIGADDASDVRGLFAKVRRMGPSRLVVGELHKDEVREFFTLLADEPGLAGLATMRADSLEQLVDGIVQALGLGRDESRTTLAAARPVFVHTHTDEKGRHRLAALWDAAGMAAGELVLREVDTGPAAAQTLAAET
jgi:hypothetical protein